MVPETAELVDMMCTNLRHNQWGRNDQPTPHGEEVVPRKDLREWKQGLKQELKRELVKDITTVILESLNTVVEKLLPTMLPAIINELISPQDLDGQGMEAQ